MTEISHGETILSRQLKQIVAVGTEEVIITTGLFDGILVKYCQSLDLPLHFTFVKNPEYKTTNYIYSIYCARKYVDDDILLMHEDFIFEDSIMEEVFISNQSYMTVSSPLPLPEKDFKAVVHNGRIEKVGVKFFNEAMVAQPLYKLTNKDWKVWLECIVSFCDVSNTKIYAVDALNEVSKDCEIRALDVESKLCNEIDNPEDFAVVSAKLQEVESRMVYMYFSTDIIHSGHIAIIKKHSALGN